uniref:Uncharacterized protein n=1 Tax=Brassica campestris TaxID=3711 RepID=M4F5R3_BRACM
MEKPPEKGNKAFRWPKDQTGLEIDQSHSFPEERLKDSVVELPVYMAPSSSSSTSLLKC